VSDQLEVLKDVVERLDRAGIRYMLSGSVALNYYAEPRMTRDIDLVVELTLDDVQSAAKAFSGDYYLAEESIRAAVAERGMFNLIHLDKLIKADFIVRKDTDYRRAEFARRREVVVGGTKVNIVTPEDLLLSKLEWSRDGRSEVQMNDARNLLDSVREMDWGYVEVWSERLGLGSLLKELRL